MSIVSKEEYWTTILNDYSQFGQITTEDSEFNSIANDVWNVLENSFIKIDDEESIIKWEEMTGLSGEGLTIFQRKVNILYTLTVKNYLPISLFTQAMDRLVGKDNYSLEIDEETNKFCINYDNSNDWNKIKFIKNKLSKNLDIIDGNALPEGYIVAEFLEHLNGDSFTSIPLTYNGNTSPGFEVIHDVQFTTHNGYGLMGLGGGSYDFWRVWGDTGTKIGFDGNSLITVDDIKNRRKIIFAIHGKKTYLTIGDKTISAYRSSDRGEVKYSLFFVNPYSSSPARIFGAKIKEGGYLTRNLRPAISPDSRICFFDLVSKTIFEPNKKNNLIVGLTNEQVQQLSKLPPSDTYMTISLLEGYENNEEIIKILNDLRVKGLTISVRTYTNKEIATFSRNFKNIWVRKIYNENGCYIDKNNIKCDVDWCIEIYSPDNKTPEDFGYEQFRSVDSALSYWELTPYIHPELEEIINEQNL